MKLKTIVSGLTLATAAAVIAVPSHAGVKYDGDIDAARICKAIMEDDPSALKRAVRHASPNTAKLRAQQQKHNFQCNGMNLDEFAASVGAKNTLAVLGVEADETVAVR